MKIKAQTVWTIRESDDFYSGKYSREHKWIVDGGMEIKASASPEIVPIPFSNPTLIDPEEAFLLSVSSCHLLWFLSIARDAGYEVIEYKDLCTAILEKDSEKKLSITEVHLHPRIKWRGVAPSATKYKEMHDRAHESCFIANSIKASVHVHRDSLA